MAVIERRSASRLMALLALAAVVLLAAPALAQPLSLPVTVRQGGIWVRAERGLESLAARVAERAPDTVARIRADLGGLPIPRTLEIRLVKQASDMSQAAPPGRGAPEWASGVAYSDAAVAVVATRRGAQPIEVDSVVDHELAHLVLGVALDGHAPRWLSEGFAYLHSSDWSIARVRILTGMVWFDDASGLDQIDRRFGGGPGDIDRAYAQSYDFVAYLARRGRYSDPDDDGNRWPFRQFLTEVAAGHTVYGAALSAYGVHLNQLYAEWYQDLRNRYLLMPAGMVALGVWVLAALLLVAAYIRRRLQSKKTMARWEREEQAFDLPGSPAAHAAGSGWWVHHRGS